PAALKAWQAPHPWLVNTVLPAAGDPAGSTIFAGGFGFASLPTTDFAVGRTTWPLPHPPSRSAPAPTTTAAPRIAAQSTQGPPVELGESPSPRRRLDSRETQGLRSRRRSLRADALHELPARVALRRLRRRALPGPERRSRLHARDRPRAGVLPVLHLGQARPARLRREGRRARPGARVARHGRAALRDGRPADAARADHRHRH